MAVTALLSQASNLLAGLLVKFTFLFVLMVDSVQLWLSHQLALI